jgi:4-hydroxybenzoate polyprenyltransferase
MMLMEVTLFSSRFLLLFVGAATCAGYTFLRLAGLRDKQENSTSEMLDWVRKFKYYLGALLMISGSVAIYALFHLSETQQIIIATFSTVGLFYGIPCIPYKGKLIPLRQIPYLKVFLVAIVWTTITCVTVFATSFPILVRPQYLLFSVMTFIYIFALTMVFDIRDYEFDKGLNIKTIAHTLGIEKTKSLAKYLLILYIVLGFFFYIYIPCDIYYPNFFRSYNLPAYIGFLVGGLGSIFIIKNITKQSSETVYTFQLDGIIILQSVFILLIYLMNYF